jgi:transketolase
MEARGAVFSDSDRIKVKDMNEDLRKRIVQMVYHSKDGHIPSAFSIIDILEVLYRDYLKFDPQNPRWPERDYFILVR